MSIWYLEFAMRAELWVHPESVPLLEEELEQVVLHEFGHLLLVDLYNNFLSAVRGQASHQDRSNTEERACWRFAKSLQGAYRLGQSGKS